MSNTQKQPEALRLADEMERGQFTLTLKPAAAELRRLHSFNNDLMDAHSAMEKINAILLVANEELLETLKEIFYETGDPAAANAIASISRDFGVSESLIRAIKNKEVWNEK